MLRKKLFSTKGVVGLAMVLFLAAIFFTSMSTVIAGTVCEGDFDRDSDVDGSDLTVFSTDFGRTDCGTGPSCEGDFDGDGDVDGSDLATFAADFGSTDCLKGLVFNLDVGQDGTFDTFWLAQPGMPVLIDIYVSEVSEPGLIGIGFDLIYDPELLEVSNRTEVFTDNWPLSTVDLNTPGIIEMKGCRFGSGLAGNLIKLGTIELIPVSMGISSIWLFDTDRGGTIADFVLGDGKVLDYQIKDGIFLIEIIS